MANIPTQIINGKLQFFPVSSHFFRNTEPFSLWNLFIWYGTFRRGYITPFLVVHCSILITFRVAGVVVIGVPPAGGWIGRPQGRGQGQDVTGQVGSIIPDSSKTAGRIVTSTVSPSSRGCDIFSEVITPYIRSPWRPAVAIAPSKKAY